MKVIFIWIYDVYFFFIMIYVVYLHLYGESLFYKKVNYIVLFYTSCQDLKKKLILKSYMILKKLMWFVLLNLYHL